MTPSTIQCQPYPEEIKELNFGELEVEVVQPESHHVVMGAGGKTEKEVFADRLEERGVPLYKRKGGGGTVLLGPETLVVTVHCGVAHLYRNLAYFQAINESLIEVFRTWKDLDYSQKGISDIAVENRKIVGSSIFRRRQYLLYQASILVNLDLETMNALLKPPPKEPDYRKGRPHSDFVTCLADLGVDRNHNEMIHDLKTMLPASLKTQLARVDRQPESI